MPSFSKSCSMSEFFSQTMSTCPCSTVIGAPSHPGEAGASMTMLPMRSSRAARPSSAAVRRTWARTRASCFDGRGTADSAAKRFQTDAGSRASREAVGGVMSVSPGQVADVGILPALPARLTTARDCIAGGSGNSIPDYVPVENYLAMIRAAQWIRRDERN